MIIYKNEGVFSRIFKIFQLKGSVFPGAILIALPPSIVTALLRWCLDSDKIDILDFMRHNLIVEESSAWSGFTFLVGFLVVFRTRIAYDRFWDGCTATHLMRAEWFDACSAIIAFCKHTKAGEELVLSFQHVLVRLFIMLHAMALGEIEDSNSEEYEEILAFNMEVIDLDGIDEVSLLTLKDADAKVELVFQWIQQLIVENINTGVLSIPPPILSRVFQELANGMVAFHEAIQVSTIPFPFPYAQTCELLLLWHWLLTPFVMVQWVNSIWWAPIFSFIQVFILHSLNCTALEIENPFGHDANDLDESHMQIEMNKQLILLLLPGTQRTPVLSSEGLAIIQRAKTGNPQQGAQQLSHKINSFSCTWQEIETRQSKVSRASLRASDQTASTQFQGAHSTHSTPSVPDG